ncbi:proposed amino acid ligase found clustered with an amidotransferase [Microbacterium esteraromaticum]|uniref:Lipid II isoglutaminyl synthase (glutamine-hydrolyzing) subunit MurT n=1 Tax=Microbacterium esteraromaticum TaxID=57043 RepID=A0A1R4IV04_9MICO|nr:MurT ligase domain-containing protein [Microbacterium esteraromaticum]SJN23544.1 proposed amino acid ligase found clustered with an amidotransferase [Microbacterium esteraromaticum]
MMSKTPQARSAGLRYVFPVLAGKLARFATRLRGGGSAFPGYLTNRLAPTLLPTLADQFGYGVVFVLGSNGKTTTTHMISEVLRAHGLRVFTNPTGANLPQGVTSALLADATLTGRIRADVAVLEVDEGYAADLADQLSPAVILSLNVQVDQLYRFYETERVADMMLEASKRANAHVVVNRDDPYLSKIDVDAMPAPVTFFGVAPEIVAAAAHGLANAADTRSGNAGIQARDAYAEVRSVQGRDIDVHVGGVDTQVRLPARGLHYAADAAAALAVASHVLGGAFSADSAADGFARMAPAYGRGEVIPLRGDPAGEQVEFVMFKNAPSLQMNLDALDGTPEHSLIAIDEGTPDVSWLYDVDFDALQSVDVVTGEKAYQLALALEHAGVRIGTVEPDMEKAVALMREFPKTTAGRQTWFVNYELMMIGRRILGHGDQEVARR